MAWSILCHSVTRVLETKLVCLSDSAAWEAIDFQAQWGIGIDLRHGGGMKAVVLGIFFL